METDKSPIENLDSKRDNFTERLANRKSFSYDPAGATIPSINMIQPKQNIPTSSGDAGEGNMGQQPKKPRVEKTQFKELFKNEDRLPERSIRNEMRDKKEKKDNEEEIEEDEDINDSEGLDENGNPLDGMVKALDEDGNEVVVEQPVKPKFPSMIFGIAIISDALGMFLGFSGVKDALLALPKIATVVGGLFAIKDLVMALAAFVLGWMINIMCIGILFTWFHKGDHTKLSKTGTKVSVAIVRKIRAFMKGVKITSTVGEAFPIINIIPFNSFFVIVAHYSNRKLFKIIIKAVEAFEFIGKIKGK